ncbi:MULTISPECIES: mobilization protein MbpA [Flavobacterium]|uniref:Mobilization protein n=1 Tax=Flavobacterium okayamense TaxID=2830782 RepID=A0ABM7S7B3_9FLAO|nr:mobilization protein MbpA [Flavobacterium okayamense]BCY29413.1 hypothetical protein KK2020170_22810 [Flavobacterium okayamense]
MKNVKIEFRCSLFDKKLIKIKAQKSGLTVSDFCRNSALDKTIVEKLNQEHIEFYKMLIKYHNNFKSIGNLIKNKDPLLHQKVNELADEIRTHLKNFQK